MYTHRLVDASVEIWELPDFIPLWVWESEVSSAEFFGQSGERGRIGEDVKHGCTHN